jgi:hypothetical protein
MGATSDVNLMHLFKKVEKNLNNNARAKERRKAAPLPVLVWLSVRVVV